MTILNWAKSYDSIGNALGYSTHAKMLRAALERRSDVQVVEDDSGPISVHIVTPPVYMPDYNKFNVLYTMYEMAELPPDWIEPLLATDLIVVPCSHNQALFKGYLPKNHPVDIVLEGVDVEAFEYFKRTKPKLTRFVYLWVGASNPRKGYQYAVAAWARLNNLHPEIAGDILLYLKTTQVSEDQVHIVGYEKGKPVREKVPRERILASGNIRFDSRKIPFEGEGGLIEMYHKAHAFLFPTMGEGFGLTLAEAMATGLPCIYTPWSGPVDFCSPREAYPIKFGFTQVRSARVMLNGEKDPMGFESYAADPRVEDIERRMYQIYRNYDAALEKGRLAAERIRREITWDISAARFLEVVKARFQESRGEVKVSV